MSKTPRKGAPQASEPCRTPSMPSDLAMLEAEFWQLWSKFPTAKVGDLSGLHERLDTVFGCIAKTPIASVSDAAIKARVALQRAGLTPERFSDDPVDHPEKVAAEILDQVVGYLEREGRQ